MTPAEMGVGTQAPGVCGSQVDPVGPGAESVRGGFLHGSLDPMTGAITFEYQAVSDFANDKGENVGVTDRAVTFTGTGAMTSDDKAAGTATWVMECHGGTSVPCIEGWPVKVGSSMSVTGTIDRAMTFTR